ncbi:MAG: hypothetical protein JSS81_16900 [Acidobacteria bacterium]|nr:hypothetical protein [Acidobacteriota bacterium]
MSRKRKTIPRAAQAARERLNGMKAVDPNLDLGNGVTVETFSAVIDRLIDEIDEYNQMLADVDARSNRIDAELKIVKDYTKRALTGAEYKFGDDSNEYEMIGGTRESDRRRGRRKREGGPGEMK